jgi:hypothetical protein
MECWNDGILCYKSGEVLFKLFPSLKSIIPMFQYSKWGEALLLSIFSEPIPDLFSPDLYSLMMLRITLLKMFQKTLYGFTPRRKDRQPNQDK